MVRIRETPNPKPRTETGCTRNTGSFSFQPSSSESSLAESPGHQVTLEARVEEAEPVFARRIYVGCQEGFYQDPFKGFSCSIFGVRGFPSGLCF